jgi:hypothetical protein
LFKLGSVLFEPFFGCALALIQEASAATTALFSGLILAR